MRIRLVLQIQCKLFVFDKTSQSWVERGRGLLRLNDMASTDDGTLQSRLGELWPVPVAGLGNSGPLACVHGQPSTWGTHLTQPRGSHHQSFSDSLI